MIDTRNASLGQKRTADRFATVVAIELLATITANPIGEWFWPSMFLRRFSLCRPEIEGQLVTILMMEEERIRQDERDKIAQRTLVRPSVPRFPGPD